MATTLRFKSGFTMSTVAIPGSVIISYPEYLFCCVRKATHQWKQVIVAVDKVHEGQWLRLLLSGSPQRLALPKVDCILYRILISIISDRDGPLEAFLPIHLQVNGSISEIRLGYNIQIISTPATGVQSQ